MAEPGTGYVPAEPNTPWSMYERTPAASLWESDTDTVVQRGRGWTYITDIPDASPPPWRQI